MQKGNQWQSLLCNHQYLQIRDVQIDALVGLASINEYFNSFFTLVEFPSLEDILFKVLSLD